MNRKLTKLVNTTNKVFKQRKVIKKMLSDKDIMKVADSSIIRTVLNRANTKKYLKDTNTIVNRSNYMDSIPFINRFKHDIDSDFVNNTLKKYLYDNNKLSFETVTIKDKRDNDIILDDYKKQKFLISIDDNMKNACYVYVLNYINLTKKFLKMQSLLKQGKQFNKKTMDYYKKMESNKILQRWILKTSYYNIKGNKEFKENRLMYSLCFVFSKKMYEAYNEKNSYQKELEYKQNITLNSINDENNEYINNIGTICNEFYSVDIELLLKQELAQTEYNIIKDIRQGYKYKDIQFKYSVSSKTISKIKDKVLKLICVNVDKKSNAVIEAEYKNILKGIQERQDKEKQGYKENTMLSNHKVNTLKIKYVKVLQHVSYKDSTGKIIHEERFVNEEFSNTIDTKKINKVINTTNKLSKDEINKMLQSMESGTISNNTVYYNRLNSLIDIQSTIEKNIKDDIQRLKESESTDSRIKNII